MMPTGNPRPSTTAQCPASLVDLLRERATHSPNQTVFTFLGDGEEPADALTFEQLDANARAFASILREHTPPGVPALLLFPPGLEFVTALFGCLYAGVVAVPTAPPRPKETGARLEHLIRDSGANCVIGDQRSLAGFAALSRGNATGRAIKRVDIDQMHKQGAGAAVPVRRGDNDLAFLQYTSGSTGAPKGVMVTHANVMDNLARIYRQFAHGPDTKGMIWLPPYHDMGLVGGILQPVYGGFPVVLMSPISFLQRPVRWLRAISKYRATTSGGPNFAYELCIRKVSEEQRADLDLSSWRVAFNGAEPIRANTHERFSRLYAPYGFHRSAMFPCYGLAESTLLVTGGPKGEGDYTVQVDAGALERNEVVHRPGCEMASKTLVSSGVCPADAQIRVVDPHTCRPCEPGYIGEIWLDGHSVTPGYWGRPASTERLRGYLVDAPQAPFLRTGDLGFVFDGRLFVTGRISDLIVLRGRNIYPHDVERTAENAHPALRPGASAAFSIDNGVEEQLVIVAEVERSYARRGAAEEILASVRAAIQRECGARVTELVLVKPGAVPRTTSGKIQRRKCREAYLASGFGSVLVPAPTGRSAVPAG